MEKFEFKSAICTSIEQSKRLLELGLKKETADMHISNISSKGINYTDDWQIGSIPYCNVMSFWDSKGLQLEKTAWSIIPAWSLHRLLFLIPKEINIYGFKFPLRSDMIMRLKDADYMYDRLIGIIERVINEGYFNKDYLEKD